MQGFAGRAQRSHITGHHGCVDVLPVKCRVDDVGEAGRQRGFQGKAVVRRVVVQPASTSRTGKASSRPADRVSRLANVKSLAAMAKAGWVFCRTLIAVGLYKSGRCPTPRGGVDRLANRGDYCDRVALSKDVDPSLGSFADAVELLRALVVAGIVPNQYNHCNMRHALIFCSVRACFLTSEVSTLSLVRH